MPPKKSSIVLNVEQFIHDIEERPAIWNRNFHCNKAFLEQMWDELSSEHKLPKVVLKAKWKGLRDNFRVEYKRIPRGDSGDFLVEPAAFESKWTHYYALLFLTEHMRHRMPKNNASEDGQQSYLYGQQGDDCERTIVEPDLTNGLVRRLNDSDEEFDEDDVEEDDEEDEDTDLVNLLRKRQTTVTPPAAHANSYHGSLSTTAIKTEDARALLKLSGIVSSNLDDDTAHSNSNGEIEKEAQDLSKKSMTAEATTALSNRTAEISGALSRICALPNAAGFIQSQASPTAVNFSTSRSESPASSVNNIAAHIGASTLMSAISTSALNTTPIKVVSVTNAIASQQHKKRSVSPPPLYNKAHHPLATAIIALSTKERTNGEDFGLNAASNCHIHHHVSSGVVSNSNGVTSNDHLNFTKHSYANGLIPALKMKRPRLSEDSQFNGSSTMDTTTTSNASTTTSAAHSPLQNSAATPTNGALSNAQMASALSTVPEDDDYHYLLSLHPYMKQMNAAQKLRIRTKFQKLIFKELYKEELEESEVYVLDDGGEVDLDLGNYERFLDITLHRDNNITTGKIYQSVIEKERTGEYLGKTVQVVPHITNAIQEWVERVAQSPVRGSSQPQVCIVELGGTIGDIEGMPFVEAFRQFQFRVKRENFCVAHVSLVPSPRSTGEPKTKPTQSSVRELRGFGLSPDLIVCRSEKPIGSEVKEKISNFCHVLPDQVICIHDLSSIYHVPLLMQQHGVIEFLNDRLKLNIQPSKREKCLQKWKDLARRTEILRTEVTIGIVGKYTKLEDSYASVVKSLQHASVAVGRKLVLQFIDSSHLENEMKETEPSRYYEAWQQLCKCDGVLVPGGFGSRGIEGKILACNWCREKKKPFLGICLGLQAAVVAFARNVLGLTEANSTEIDPTTKHPLVIDMPEHHTGQMGGTMRLGKRTTVFSPEYSVIRQLYGNPDTVEERHRHRYEVNPKYVPELEAHGMRFVGCDTDKRRMEIIELKDHPYYVATQYHPEYLSRPMKPSPPFLGLILASIGRLQNFIARGCRFSPRQLSDASDDEESAIAVSDIDEDETAARLKKSLQINGNGPTPFASDNGATLSIPNGHHKPTSPAASDGDSSANTGDNLNLKAVSSTSSLASSNENDEAASETSVTTKIYLNGVPNAVA